MAKQVARVESMPRAARATPYIPADLSEMNMMAESRTTGIITDCAQAKARIRQVSAPAEDEARCGGNLF